MTARTLAARLGYTDTDRVLRLLDGLGDPGHAEHYLEVLGSGADPDVALLTLRRLVDTRHPRVEQLLADPHAPTNARLLRRLAADAGASRALAEHLCRHPGDLDILTSARLPVPAGTRRDDLLAAVAGLTGDEADDALKRAYRRHLLAIATVDLASPDAAAILDLVTGALADLADAALSAALDIAARETPDADTCRLSVVALGKTGAGELNYISDVDVLYVAEPVRDGPGPLDEERALTAATRMATRLQRVCGGVTAEGSLWQVDANLRPEGRNGPLVRTLESHRAYYERWASTWEFQAMLKARHAAGDADLTAAWWSHIEPLVWSASSRDGFVEAARAMRTRVIDLIPARTADRELKLGRGGLRDVEFAVQLLQLVHGRTDDRLRVPATLPALEALTTHGYVGRDDGAELDRAYRFLRVVEHRLQMHRMSRTHVLPDQEQAWRRLARATQGPGGGPEELKEQWRRHRRSVARLHEKLFYRPLLTAVARLSTDEVRLTEEAARARLQALGYADPAGALRHLSTLTAGISRRADIQRALLPVMLAYLADGADPDAGLLAFRRISDSLGNTHWYLRMLRDSSGAAERFASVLASGRLVPDLLTAAPDTALLLGGPERLRPPPGDGLLAEGLAVGDRTRDAQNAARAVRGVHRRETIRTAIGEITGMLSADEVGPPLAASAVVALEVAVRAAARAWLEEREVAADVSLDTALEALPTRLLIVAFGSVAAGEGGYGSDVDVVAVHEPCEGADPEVAASCARDVVAQARQLLRMPAAEPAVPVDPALRPEGRSGELVRSFDALRAYYDRWSSPWEHQALLRARPVIGPPDLAQRFVDLVDPLRYPQAGLSPAAVAEMRRLKARMEAERLPRGVDPRRHVKLGRGGLTDIEWTVQYVQMQHAHEVPQLRTPSTRLALRAAVSAELIAVDDAARLEAARLQATRMRHAIALWRGRAGDVLPTDRRDLDGIGRLLGLEPGSASEVEDQWARDCRRARAVVERLFFGWS